MRNSAESYRIHNIRWINHMLQYIYIVYAQCRVGIFIKYETNNENEILISNLLSCKSPIFISSNSHVVVLQPNLITSDSSFYSQFLTACLLHLSRSI